jgi:hypothetical protein
MDPRVAVVPTVRSEPGTGPLVFLAAGARSSLEGEPMAHPNAELVGSGYHGHQEVMGFFGKLFESSSGTSRLDIHDITGTDEHVRRWSC